MYRLGAVRRIATIAGLVLTPALATPAFAQTMDHALAQAYQNNPQLNAQRASVRVTDEGVPQALSGYRPRINVTASVSEQYSKMTTTSALGSSTMEGWHTPRTIGGTATQVISNGMQTSNRVRAAESQVSAAREGLRVLEQTVLLAAATVYMDYLRDAAIVDVQRSNVRVLQETLRQTRDRFNVGEVTRTDVAQSEAQLAAGRTQLLAAESTLNTTRANFRRVIGVDPGRLSAAAPVDRLSPRTMAGAIELALMENPNVTAAMYGIDVSFLQVKINEGALFPTVALQASVQQAWDSSLSVPSSFAASVGAQMTVPIFQG